MPQRGEPIAIIGSGCRFPGNSDTPSKLWELLREPRDLLTEIPEDRFNARAFYHPDPEHHGTTNVQKSYFLSDDIRRFDAPFFGIQPKEADSIDPQQRMLMETVYESLCAAGQTIEGLRGSPTAVYVGLMCDDWSGMMGRDWDSFPTYTATGISRSIMSNRVSYFFDWHGPSMTIDTACSSSLVAVHQAVQALRSGESRVAIAAGANLILSPGMYIAESKLHMLSATGRSRMWDADADGYARGEGFASVVLKRLSSAIEDGDHIECIIRETGVNQDGRTTGITMPSNTAQTALIKETYAKAGLDVENQHDRPQFFHAHGTGTPAGDPQEAEAISRAFPNRRNDDYNTLYVGSIKTVIGHTEGTAGLASLIGSSLAIQHRIIPPNMHFENLSKNVAPFYHGLDICKDARPWPAVPSGQPRRASVNSFGFGGTNAHAIIESYEFEEKHVTEAPLFTPLTLSAASERALRALLVSYAEYLRSTEKLDLRNLAWTLQSRRSALPFKTAISGRTIETLCSGIDSQLRQSEENKTDIGVRAANTSKPRILGVFTGQGAQWATMGRELVRNSTYVRELIAALDRSLAELPENDRPSWSIKEELCADASTSGIGNASLSQPLCTAVQIVLVNLLRSAGIQLQAVVGHSSGEIGAAYAAGFISASDAMRIAYYRGFYARLARSQDGKKGAMMAVGTTLGDARDFCDLEDFQGRLVVAASNSSASITLSGDDDAIDQAIEIFKDEQKFARRLNVDTAYHSFHMEPCSVPYLKSISECGIKVENPNNTAWFSSVVPGQRMTVAALTDSYWVDNMVNPVMFSSAVTAAVSENASFDISLEIGPHPALKGPCLACIEEASGAVGIPYSGLLSRGINDVEAVSGALGFLWTHTGPSSVDFDTYDRLISGSMEPRTLVVDLPLYPWDRQRSYWTESRVSGSFRSHEVGPHPLLGAMCTESTTPQEVQWRNLLRKKEIPWLDGHKLQGQIVFPASGYATMAVEGALALAGERTVSLVEIQDLTIGRAMAFNDESSTVETLLSLELATSTLDSSHSGRLEATFRSYSCPQGEQSMSLNANGRVMLHFGDAKEDLLPSVLSKPINMVNVDIERFYISLGRLGYNYSYPFRGITSLKRKVDAATGILVNPPGIRWEDKMLIHPGMLDTAFQTIFAAYCSPGDNRLWSLHVPTNIGRILINPRHSATNRSQGAALAFQSAMLSSSGDAISADVDIFCEDGQHSFIQIESVKLVPFSRASPENDSVLFSKFVWDVASPDGELAAQNERPTAYERHVAHDLERVCFYYLRTLVEAITPSEKMETLWHYRCLLDWASHVSTRVDGGKHPYLLREWQQDTHDEILGLINRYSERVDVRLIRAVGENLPKVIRDRSNILEYMAQDGLLSDFYEQGLGLTASNRWISRIVRQIAHRYPHMKIFEIGAGTGGATKAILGELGNAFTSYTYTDISSGFFETARERFKDQAGKMIFKTFDIEKSATVQGFTQGSYDLIIASNVLHATKELEETMRNTHQLLKPGGILVLLEVTNGEPLRNGLPMGGLTGWWVGADSGRPWGPTLSLKQWDALLRNTGFSGVDTTTPSYDTLVFPFSVFTTQAVDDHVSYLRKPLSASPQSVMKQKEHLVIVGGRTLRTSQMVEDIADYLSQRYKTISILDSVEAVQEASVAGASTVLSLTDLDEPTFKVFTAEKLDTLKILFSQARNMLWVTRGCRANDPYSNMMVGIGRAVRFEYPNINLQMFDVDHLNPESSQFIAANLLRLEAIDVWRKEDPLYNILFSSEPEIALEGGSQIIPRLFPNEEQNKRYNSSRRIITRNVNPTGSAVEIVAGTPCELRDASWRKPWPQVDKPKDNITIRVSYSLLQSVKIGSAGYLCLCLGSVVDSGQSVLALSDTNQSIVNVPQELAIACNSGFGALRILLSITSNLFAGYVTSIVPTGGALLVHEPDVFLVPTLAQRASDKDIALFCTTSKSELQGPGWIYIHPHSTNRLIKRAIPSHVSVFMDLDKRCNISDVGTRISNNLPSHCVPDDAVSFIGSCPMGHPGSSPARIRDLLQTAWTDSEASNFEVDATETVLTQSLADIPHTDIGSRISLVHWRSDPVVPVKIRPVDSESLFRPDRTYLLVGLSGELGRSLCQWMVEHGARCVVLTSRNPKASHEWIESFSSCGATVKLMSMDITSRESLHRTYDEICNTLPPIAGVANGAMILIDRTFQNMNISTMTDVLKPKVDGSKYLDELFSDNTLDFFILFSSMSSVVGNSGQSNYIAANMYMTSLAFQRKERGLAGSVIDISSLVGIGYVEHSEAVDADYFTRIGYTNISEQDLHQIFAEAMLVGRPGSQECPEIVTGLAPGYADAEVKAPYRSDLKFCHFTIERSGEKQNTGQGVIVPVKTQLRTAETKAQILDILKGNFASRLRQILQIDNEDDVSETTTLVEQGVDSLVAVEVRSWFLKEIDVDVPVLKVLGGTTMIDLLEDAIEGLAPAIVPNLASTREPEPAASASQPPSKPQQIGNIAQSVQSTSEPSAPPTDLQNFSGVEFTPKVHAAQDEPHSLRTKSSTSSGTETPSSDSRSETSRSLYESEITTNVPTPVSPNEVIEKMSFGQSRFWFLNHFLKDKTTFNMAFSARLEGPLRLADMENAVQVAGRTHEALRTRFFSVGDYMDQPMQGILDTSLVRLKHKYISSEHQATQELQDMRDHVWDLSHWESMRVTVLSLSETSHYLLVACHHIAMDGISIQILLSDLDKNYNGHAVAACSSDSQYRAFTAKQHQEYASGNMDADLDFYRRTIPKDPQAISLFPFARSSSRKLLESYGAHRVDFRLDSALTSRIKFQARKNKATPFHFYLAALQCLVFRLLEDTADFFIGIADANRTDSKYARTLGVFLNLLPLHFKRVSNQPFGQAIQDARNKVYAALGRSRLPFDLLLNGLNIPRSATHTPLFQIFVDYRQGVQERSTFAGCKAEGEYWHTAKTGYDVGLDIIENAAGDSLLTLRLQDSLYTKRDAELMLQSYMALITEYSNSPETPLNEIQLWRKEDTDSAIALGRGRTMQLNWGPTLSHRFDEIVRENGSILAIKDSIGNILTYSQAAARVNAIAAALVAANVTGRHKVAVFQEPTADWICSLLAIFRVGAVYVPLDLRTSLPRLAKIVSQYIPNLILAHNSTMDHVPALRALETKTINISAIPRFNDDTLPNRAQPSSPAVILFTSGSTGVPKGIVINHSSLRNQMESYSREWNVAAAATMVLQQSAFSFDFSIDQIFSALANGGGLFVVSATQRGDPMEITKLMVDEGITYTSATPSEYLMWTQYGSPNLKSCSRWQYAFAGGEPLPETLIQDIKSLDLAGLHFFNNYGPAEITVASTKMEVQYTEMVPGELAPAGFMLPNYSVYILDKDLNPLPVGYPGEIVIGGAGVSSGYLNNEALTKEKFIPDVFESSEFKTNGWRTMYRTGDRGRLRADGALICEGRIDGDTQVKLRGFRIELGDVESCILQAADGALTDAVVSLRHHDDVQFLVAHVVFARRFPAEDRDSFLRRLPSLLALPQYMCPAKIIALDRLPLTNHLKADRQTIKALPLSAETESNATDVGLTKAESQLQYIWQKIIPNASVITAETDFFLIGGNSLLLVKLQALIREDFDVTIPLVNLMSNSTLGQMELAIKDATAIHRIDWEKETELTQPITKSCGEIDTHPEKLDKARNNLSVLLTGSTGYLGKNLLPRLVADARISKIYCVAIRDSDTPLEQRIPIQSDKMFTSRGDLTLPYLGLTQRDYTAIARDVDLIIHSGANRSFWDNYETLRATNVTPLLELIKLALPNKIPIHFVSSGGVLEYDSRQPPRDGSNGYVASKWAAEKLLSKAATILGIPSYIHRPLPAIKSSKSTPSQVLDELSAIAMKMGSRPSFEGLHGSIDLIPHEDFLNKMWAALFDDSPSQGLQTISHIGELRVDLRRLVDHVEQNEQLKDFKTMPALEWVGQAKRNGLGYMIASQDIAMSKETGGVVKLISKR